MPSPKDGSIFLIRFDIISFKLSIGSRHAMSDGNNRFESHSHDVDDDEELVGLAKS
jgi:hypothetical protein